MMRLLTTFILGLNVLKGLAVVFFRDTNGATVRCVVPEDADQVGSMAGTAFLEIGMNGSLLCTAANSSKMTTKTLRRVCSTSFNEYPDN